MRIEKYTSELLDLAYETMEIKYYEDAKGPNDFGRMMLQELVFYNDRMLYHLSDFNEEDDPVYPCSTFLYEDITTYEFDCDNNVLTISFLHRGDAHIFGNTTQLENIYKIITTMDEKFIVTDFTETDELFREINGR